MAKGGMVLVEVTREISNTENGADSLTRAIGVDL